MTLLLLRTLAFQPEDSFGTGQEKCVSVAARKKLYARIGLSLIALKRHPQPAVIFGDLPAGDRIRAGYIAR
jgi:hypothetical protein